MVDQTIGTPGHRPALQQEAEQTGRSGIRDAVMVAGGIAFAASLGFSMITGRIPALYGERGLIDPYLGRGESIDQSQIVASDGRNAIFGWNLWSDAQPLALRRVVFESLSGPVPEVLEFLGFLQHELAEQAHIDLAKVAELFPGANLFEFAVAPINGTYPAVAFSPGGGGGWTFGEGAAPFYFQWPSWLPVPSWLMPWVQQSAGHWLPPGPPPATGIPGGGSGPVTPYAPAHAAPPEATPPNTPVAAPPPPAPDPAPAPVYHEPVVAAPDPAPVNVDPVPYSPPPSDEEPVSNVVIDLGTTTPNTPDAPPSSSAPDPVVTPQEPSGGDTGGGFGNDDSGNDQGNDSGSNNGNDNNGGDNNDDSDDDGGSGSDGGSGQGNSGSNDSGSNSGSGNDNSGSGDSGSNNDSNSGGGDSGGGDSGGGGSAGV